MRNEKQISPRPGGLGLRSKLVLGFVGLLAIPLAAGGSVKCSMDILYIVLMIGFFAASGWFVRACASLAPTEEDKK